MCVLCTCVFFNKQPFTIYIYTSKKARFKNGPPSPPHGWYHGSHRRFAPVLAWLRRCEPWGVVGVWGWAKKPVFNGQKSVFRRAEQPTQSSASIPRLCLFAADRLCTDC